MTRIKIITYQSQDRKHHYWKSDDTLKQNSIFSFLVVTLLLKIVDTKPGKRSSNFTSWCQRILVWLDLRQSLCCYCFQRYIGSTDQNKSNRKGAWWNVLSRHTLSIKNDSMAYPAIPRFECMSSLLQEKKELTGWVQGWKGSTRMIIAKFWSEVKQFEDIS